MFLNDYYRISRRASTLLILACACLASAAQTVHSEPLPLVSDLEATAKLAHAQRTPILVAFTLKRCPYCNIARRDYWVPMNGSAAWHSKVIMVELELDGAPALRDFDGKSTTAREFARRFAVRSVPTVIVFDASGAPATTPMVGLAASDFYGLYLEQSIEAGMTKVRESR